ncbi:hypothetical protein [Microseira wollei]|uniref:hypothetical protein n=1 Tax=Microseira wollei TaxID=467598 RepID=UPI001CFD0075|nr:hypothetical protein [Microseira wollei]
MKSEQLASEQLAIHTLPISRGHDIKSRVRTIFAGALRRGLPFFAKIAPEYDVLRQRLCNC